MTKKARFWVLLVLFCAAVFPAGICLAGNIAVENISLGDKDAVNNTYGIKFDISWDKSWFRAGAFRPAANWDAAWVFVKYSVFSGGIWSDWAHCTLLNSGYSVPREAQIDFGVTAGAYKGAFIHRFSPGTGRVDWDDLEVKWDYGADGLADSSEVQVKVFALEMVYIPAAEFYIGDGTNRVGGSNSHFFNAASVTDPRKPVLISAIPPYISGVNDGKGDAGDIAWLNESRYAGNLPAVRTRLGANYPTGYNAFYIMKYEISQGQYCGFLNTLNSVQAGHRVSNQYGSYRNYIKLAANGKYGCDADNNAGNYGSADWAKMNESADGEWVACNYLSWPDVAAFVDWAALRPFTELEFEKAARGLRNAVAGEYSWGNAGLEPATSFLVNGATVSETPNQGNLNYSSCRPNGPFRCGSYADVFTGRRNTPVNYYGVMDLSGNLWERTVSIMDSEKGTAVSTFTGEHGDGRLSVMGNADTFNWPGWSDGEISGASGSGFRGGDWVLRAMFSRVSDRNLAAFTNEQRYYSYGGRGARNSP